MWITKIISPKRKSMQLEMLQFCSRLSSVEGQVEFPSGFAGACACNDGGLFKLTEPPHSSPVMNSVRFQQDGALPRYTMRHDYVRCGEPIGEQEKRAGVNSNRSLHEVNLRARLPTSYNADRVE